MSTALGLAALFGVIALVMFIAVGSFVLPTLLNIAASAMLACMISKNWGWRLVLMAVISVALSINVRLPSVIADSFTEPMVRSEVSRKIVLGPSEKVRIDSDGEHVYYRRTTEPPRWGMQNDWQVRIGVIPVVDERPTEILKRSGVAVSTNPGNERVVLHIRREESMGLMQVKARLEDSGKVVATYEQRVRKAFLLEDFNYYGKFRDDWRAAFLYLTQATPWNPSKELFPQGHAPLAGFLHEAVAQAGVSADGSPTQAVLEPVNLTDRVSRSKLAVTFEFPSFDRSIPERAGPCNGAADGMLFSVTGSGEVVWSDKDFPSISVPRTPLNGYFPSLTGAVCEGDVFWLAAYHMKQLHLWQYKVSFKERSLRLQQWLLPELPAAVSRSLEIWDRKYVTLGGMRDKAVVLYVRGGYANDKYLVHGYEIEVTPSP